jgi:hypothetical protein
MEGVFSRNSDLIAVIAIVLTIRLGSHIDLESILLAMAH